MLSFSDIKLGKVVVYQEQPCVITKCDFLKMNRQKPSKKCVMKNLVTGNNIMYNFNSGDNVEEADLEKRTATYMYSGNDTLSFMLDDTYETIDLDVNMLDGKEGYLKEGEQVTLQYFNGNPISVEIPIKVSLEISHTIDVEKGNTVQGVMKEATVETGKEVKVPGFIKIGDKVIFNTVEDEYVERDTNN